jgi:hypothetical protein
VFDSLSETIPIVRIQHQVFATFTAAELSDDIGADDVMDVQV